MYQYWCNDCHEWAWNPEKTEAILRQQYNRRLKQAKKPEFIHNLEIRKLPDDAIMTM